MRKTKATDENLRALINKLSKQKAPVYKALAKDLSRPRRIRREVSLLRINNNTKEGDSVVIPGKVLSLGDLDHKVDVFALSFSTAAKEKIAKVGSANSLESAIGKKGLKVIG
jgi:large subunit ribosomal protein L18e|tara:strand:- start:323 stop:658 length:336 start_codon:yes stop_codon:yes gene_type:complete